MEANGDNKQRGKVSGGMTVGMDLDNAGPSNYDSGNDTDSDFERDMRPAKRINAVPPKAESTIRDANRKMITIPASSMAVREAKASNKSGKDIVMAVYKTKDASLVTAGLTPMMYNEDTKEMFVFNFDKYMKARSARGVKKDVTAYEIFSVCTKFTIYICKEVGIFAGLPQDTIDSMRSILWKLVCMHNDNPKFLELWRNPLMDDKQPVTTAGWYKMFREFRADVKKIKAVIADDRIQRAANKLSKTKIGDVDPDL